MQGLEHHTCGVERGPGSHGGWLLRRRFWLYGLILLVILVFRLLPTLRGYVERAFPAEEPAKGLTLTGLDLAPVLIPRLANAYQRLYPENEIRIRPGGTRQALEDLFNGRADVAFLSRPMTLEEEAIVRAVGDTALSFPIALGAITVLAPVGAGDDSLPVEELRRWFQEGPSSGHTFPAGRHFYAPDPNLGLWTSLATQLGLGERAGEGVIWLASDLEVARGVAQDPHGIGFASGLALPQDLRRLGVRAVRMTGRPESPAVIPDPEEVATGGYPLVHYLYAACRPQGGAVASGFVSFLYSGRGQRLVAREGYLPARDVPRVIQLTKDPVGKAG